MQTAVCVVDVCNFPRGPRYSLVVQWNLLTKEHGRAESLEFRNTGFEDGFITVLYGVELG